MSEINLADKIGELGQSIASIKEQVGNLGAEYTAKLEQAGTVSTELKDRTDKALCELGDVTTRIGELEKRAAREKEVEHAGFKGLGDYLVESEKFLAMDKGGRGSVRVKAERADITSANTTVGAGRSASTSLIAGHRVPGIIAPPNRTFTIRDLLAQGETSSNSIEYVKETGFTNNAAPVVEAPTTPKPKSDITFNLETTPVRTIAHIFKASRQIMDDAPALASYINARGTYGLKFVEEAQLLNGDGTGQNLNGLLPQATAFAPAFTPASANGIDRLRLAVLQVILAEYPATGFVLNPTDWAKLELTKDGEGRYIIGNAQGATAPTLWNLPVVQTQAMAVNEFLTGAFNLAAQIFDRQDVEVLLSSENEDDFVKNMLTIRVEERLALAVYRPEAFVKGDVEE
ncbi:phage major capsid protein [Brucella rhizosphaerae]|uniref:Phage major capsid protein, HK97 family n=1 Tax=Brucella rhizosphaerae TaxID=571254 RepID=A0A256FL97_9HYPH|nr:phage major capsid protein [Brucella rhizosphaerae]OYR15530.1 phage major capsid protein, HK97 family [Brucella rhizosphaerae]